MTTPAHALAPTLPTGTPTWLNNVVKALLVIIPVVFSIWKPDGVLSSATAQATVISVGVFLAAFVHVIEIIVTNFKEYGLSKTALAKDYTESQAWIEANINDLKAAFESAKQVVANTPALQPAVDAVGERVAKAEGELAAIQKRIDEIPAIDRDAIVAAVKAELARILNGATPATTVGA